MRAGAAALKCLNVLVECEHVGDFAYGHGEKKNCTQNSESHASVNLEYLRGASMAVLSAMACQDHLSGPIVGFSSDLENPRPSLVVLGVEPGKMRDCASGHWMALLDYFVSEAHVRKNLWLTAPDL